MQKFNEYVRDKDFDFAKNWLATQSSGISDVIKNIIKQSVPKGVISIFVNINGFDDGDKGKMSAYRVLADEMGIEIGQWKLNSNAGTVTASIRQKIG